MKSRELLGLFRKVSNGPCLYMTCQSTSNKHDDANCQYLECIASVAGSPTSLFVLNSELDDEGYRR